jgi:hypothetical protein
MSFSLLWRGSNSFFSWWWWRGLLFHLFMLFLFWLWFHLDLLEWFWSWLSFGDLLLDRCINSRICGSLGNIFLCFFDLSLNISFGLLDFLFSLLFGSFLI